MMNRLIAGLVMVVGALLAFYVGAKYGEAHSTNASAAATNTGTGDRTLPSGSPGARNRAGGGFGTPAASGQVVSLANGVLTIHDQQANKDVKVNVGNARITKTTQGTTADLTQNTTVTVVGSTGSDGTVNAQAISIGGGFGGLGGAGRARPSPST